MQQSVRVFHLKETTSGRSTRGSNKRIEPELKEGKLRYSNLLRACKSLTLTANFWMLINEMERQRIDISSKFMGMLDSLNRKRLDARDCSFAASKRRNHRSSVL